MSKLEKKINMSAHNRILEINYMFSKINSFDNPIDKYFFSRTVVVFTYGTLEKFIKESTEIAIGLAIKNEYYNNNHIQELMQAINYKNNPSELLDLILFYKLNNYYRNEFITAKDKGYFSRFGRIDSKAIATIINTLNLNRFEPRIKIPKLSIDNIAKKRMDFAHGDYIRDLQRFSVLRGDLSIEEVDKYINESLYLNSTTRKEIVDFITDFKNKIILFISDIK
ncbi:MAG: hypothetical protein KZY61_00750 [Clostridiaceae bacterium]|nr:hypothetical protein [Clostridiaceae bacterium]MBW4860370.1 hypothetical protein [Clostridiaceae bacterium]MBW4867183.1 hypothetical protein [Clostridiaceae bacterium]